MYDNFLFRAKRTVYKWWCIVYKPVYKLIHNGEWPEEKEQREIEAAKEKAAEQERLAAILKSTERNIDAFIQEGLSRQHHQNDGNQERSLAMRSKSKKITLGLCLIVLTACLLCGCSGNPKNFTVGTMTITLTDNFKESKMTGFDAYFVSDDVSFSVKTENASDLEYQGYEIAGLKDYAKEICSLNGISTDKLVQRNNYYYFSNTQTVSGAKYTYLHCMLKEGNNYWICEFVCKHRSYDSLEKSMLQWADSITFDQQ